MLEYPSPVLSPAAALVLFGFSGLTLSLSCHFALLDDHRPVTQPVAVSTVLSQALWHALWEPNHHVWDQLLQETVLWE